MGKLLPVCLLCNTVPKEGFIKGGVVLQGKFLCHKCEKHILELSASDADYEEVVNMLESLWSPKGGR